jgi:Holliday junction resolvasome RuvABC DNA-binding subunit
MPKKMAQKIILELKGKLDLSDTAVKASSNQMEAVEALKSLGYDQGTVQAVLAQAPDGEDTEGLVKFFLSHA